MKARSTSSRCPSNRQIDVNLRTTNLHQLISFRHNLFVFFSIMQPLLESGLVEHQKHTTSVKPRVLKTIETFENRKKTHEAPSPNSFVVELTRDYGSI